MLPHLSRRRFGVGLAACVWTAAADAALPDCLGPDQLPGWVSRLRADLEQMARELTTRLQPWKGPTLVLTPERFGRKPSNSLATDAIQAAIDGRGTMHPWHAAHFATAGPTG